MRSVKLERELVREILLALEQSEHDPYDSVELEIPGWSSRQVSYHLMILSEAGYLVAEDCTSLAEELEWEACRLTFAGHEFLDTMRNPEVWRRAKEGASRVGGASLQVLMDLGKAYLKQLITERTGLSLG